MVHCVVKVTWCLMTFGRAPCAHTDRKRLWQDRLLGYRHQEATRGLPGRDPAHRAQTDFWWCQRHVILGCRITLDRPGVPKYLVQHHPACSVWKTLKSVTHVQYRITILYFVTSHVREQLAQSHYISWNRLISATHNRIKNKTLALN